MIIHYMLHVQCGETISTDNDFSEGETLFMTPAVRFYDYVSNCPLLASAFIAFPKNMLFCTFILVM